MYSKRCGFDGFLQDFCKVFVDFCRGGGVDLFVNALYSCALFKLQLFCNFIVSRADACERRRKDKVC